MRRSGLLLLLPLAVVSSAAACGRSGFLAEEAGGGAPLPHLPGSGGDDDDDLTPTPEATPGWDSGNGTNGPFTADGSSVNVCHRVTAAAGAGVTLTDATGMSAGMRVLLLQVQGLASASGDTALVALDASAVGQWEIREITAIANTTLSVDAPLTGAYASDGSSTAQACTLPQFSTVTVPDGASVPALAWDGASGGVVAFYAHSLDVLGTGAITASARGFRGGQARPNANGTADNIALDTTNGGESGGKGEGFDVASWDMSGKGNRGIAGGGGNSEEAGGGGGGGFGSGGFGGSQQSNVGRNTETRGLGGAGIDSAGERLVFGGGGGAGQRDGSGDSRGGNGGGIVLLFVGTLTGDGAIRANGESRVTVNADAAGGGGAGGSVRLHVFGSAAFTGEIEALGGKGGDYNNILCRGTGGGGGGGSIAIRGGGGSALTGLATEGLSGICTDDGSTWDATAGNAGSASVFP